MKNKTKIITVLILVLVLAFVLDLEPTGKVIDSPSTLVESCFIKLEIDEEKVGDDIQFTLGSQENLYGNHKGLVNHYDEEFGIKEDYTLRTYDSGNSRLNSFSLSSSRFLLYDTFSEDEDNLGGTIKTDSGTISVIIPHTENIASIKIENNGTETDLNINPSEIICERTCKIEDEIGNLDNDNCCIGFIRSIREDNSFICTNCGDGICSDDENNYLCAEDCALNFSCPDEMFKLTDSCSNKEQRIQDWKEGRISIGTLMKDTRDLILPSLNYGHNDKCDDDDDCGDGEKCSDANTCYVSELDSCATLDVENGNYLLTQVLGDIEGTCFTITADGVTLDFGRSGIFGDDYGVMDDYGVYSSGHSGITIKNGELRSFGHGIFLSDVSNSNIEDMLSHYNKGHGIYLSGGSGNNLIDVEASDNTIDGLRLASNGNTVTGTFDDNGENGIYFDGPDNTVSGSASGNSLYDVWIYGSNNDVSVSGGNYLLGSGGNTVHDLQGGNSISSMYISGAQDSTIERVDVNGYIDLQSSSNNIFTDVESNTLSCYGGAPDDIGNSGCTNNFDTIAVCSDGWPLNCP